MADAVVVGAGMGGLSAAIDLAARGHAVQVLEALPRPGGKLNVATVDGVEFDTGPSVLTLPDTLDALFRLAGTSLADQLTLIQPEPAFRYEWPDGTELPFAHDADRTRESVHAVLGADAAADFTRFLAYSRRIWEAAAPHFVFGPAPSAASLLRIGVGALGALARIDPLRSMNRAIAARVRSEHLRMIFQRFATYNGSDPRRAPATLNCIAHVELGLGGWGVQGGMYGVARALAGAAVRLGVVVRCGERVVRVHRSAGRITGVETAAGERIQTGVVVGNADAAHLWDSLLDPVGSGRGSLGPEPSMSGWTGVLRARRRIGPAARAPHTVFFPSDYMQEFADIFDRGRAPTEPTLYLCAQQAAHGRAGWPEHEPVFVMANAPAEPLDPQPGSEPRDSELRERVERRLDGSGLRDAEDAWVWQRTPAGLASDFPGSRGSIYGASSNSPLAAFRRPGNRVRSTPGLYLASGSAHPGGGVPLCLLSGRAAAAAVHADRGRGAP